MKTALLCALVVTFHASADDTVAKRWLLLEHVQRLATEYPEAQEDETEQALRPQRELLESCISLSQELAPQHVKALVELRAPIAAGADAHGVRQKALAVASSLAGGWGIALAPAHAPDLARGERTYRQRCAVCHGGDGRADVPLANELSPRPENLLSADAVETSSPFRTFVVLSAGVSGTAMSSYPMLTQSQRWELAFFVATMRHAPCQSAAPKVALPELSTSSDSELASRYGEGALACLRQGARVTETSSTSKLSPPVTGSPSRTMRSR